MHQQSPGERRKGTKFNCASIFISNYENKLFPTNIDRWLICLQIELKWFCLRRRACKGGWEHSELSTAPEHRPMNFREFIYEPRATFFPQPKMCKQQNEPIKRDWSRGGERTRECNISHFRVIIESFRSSSGAIVECHIDSSIIHCHVIRRELSEEIVSGEKEQKK